METIKLRARLSAYSKGLIPNMEGYIKDAPEDSKLYARKNKQWESFEIPTITTPENSNIIITKEGSEYNISTKEFTGKESDVQEWKEGWTYYIID